MTGFTAADVPDQSGRTMLVTGANTGLGFEVAKVLAARGGRVLLGCRDEGRASAAMARIADEVPGANLAFVPLDQADLASVAGAAQRVAAEPRLDGLINNAGVMMTPLWRTVQGFELQFGVNHLGTFALTGLLLPKLAESGGGRVVMTASLAHKRGRIDWDDLSATRTYDRYARYGQSKLANLLFTQELDRRLRAAGSPVTAYACHPGISTTELGRNLPALVKPLFQLSGGFTNPPAAGAWPALQAATDPAAVPGEYYGPQGLFEIRGPSGVAKRKPWSREAGAARRLWEISAAMTGIDPVPAPA